MHACRSTLEDPTKIQGADVEGVFVYRTLDDLRAIRAFAAGARTAAVIGGGLLGLEAARALRHLNLDVAVVELAPALMPSQLDNAAAAVLRREVEALGITTRTGTMTRRIDADGPIRRLCFADGTTLAVDMVVVAAGIRPRADVAQRCGLERGPAGAISIDGTLTTSDPLIHAIGECASLGSRVFGLVAPGYAMADVLAENLTGGRATFAGADTSARLKLLEIQVATTGEPLDGGTAARFERNGIYRVVRLERGRLTGALGVGSWPEFSRVQDAATRRRRIWPWQVRRFERCGEIWRVPRRRAPVTAWPADAIVCNCLSMTRGQLAVACAAGGTTPDALAAATGAGTVCGSCRPLLAELTGLAPAAIPPPRQRPLLGASVAAALACAAILALTPIPFAGSVADAAPLDALWRNAAARQASGFTLLGLCALAGALSARKRWRRVSIGGFTTWRAVHALIGVITLAALIVHTGLRTGRNLTLALMVSFVILNALGAAAGAVTAVEGHLGEQAGRRWRAALVLLHILGVWPLPVLVAFHVLAVYYF